MTLQAHLLVGSVLHISRFPAAWMGSGAARLGAVALDTDVTLGVACLARLQISACFGGMLADSPGSCRSSTHHVRLDAHITSGEAAMAGVAE